MQGQLGALQQVPLKGTVFISVKNDDKTQQIVSVAYQLHNLGFSLISTSGTAAFLKENGIEAEVVKRVSEGGTDLLERMRSQKIQLIINTPFRRADLTRDYRGPSTARADSRMRIN